MHQSTNITGNPISNFHNAGIFDFGHLQHIDFQCLFSCKNALTFTGKEKDSETGFYYFGARYYDPSLSGLFLSVDPMADKYPSISPYAYCAWNPVKLVDPDGKEFSEEMEKNVKIIEAFCQEKIAKLTALSQESGLSERQQDDLTELQNTMAEIKSMRDDKTTFYDVQYGSFGDEKKRDKGITEYYGFADISRNGEKQHWIMVSLNTDRHALTKEGELSLGGLHTLAHELKHCYQFYNKELCYIQTANSGEIKVYNTEALEKAAFKRGSAFGSLDRYNPNLYHDISKGTMDDFINNNPGCKIFKHK